MKVYGYARVSSKEQNLDRQIKALQDFGVKKQNIFCDKSSGKDFKRIFYLKLIKKISEKDLLVIQSIDRLGRNYNDVLEQWRIITKIKKCDIVVLNMPLLDTRTDSNGLTGTFIADITLQILSYVSEIERINIKERQVQGIAIAKAKGVKFGRPTITKPKNFNTVINNYKNGSYSRKIAANILGVSESTFIRWLKN